MGVNGQYQELEVVESDEASETRPEIITDSEAAILEVAKRIEETKPLVTN